MARVGDDLRHLDTSLGDGVVYVGATGLNIPGWTSQYYGFYGVRQISSWKHGHGMSALGRMVSPISDATALHCYLPRHVNEME